MSGLTAGESSIQNEQLRIYILLSIRYDLILLYKYSIIDNEEYQVKSQQHERILH